MAKKKITRKQLLKEPDEFITFSGQMIQLAIKYKNQIVAGLGIICVLLVLLSGFLYFSSKAEKKAFVLMQQGITKYETILNVSGPLKAYQAVEKDFEFILQKYSNKDGGKLARITYANICYRAGKYDKAITLYDKSLLDLDGHQPHIYLTLSGLGYAYEAKKDFQTAARYFQMIVSKDDAIMTDEALFNLGRLYALMGQTKKSNDSFKKIVSDYPDSIYIDIAKDKVAG